MPTFMVFKDGQKVDSMQGAIPGNLQVRVYPLCLSSIGIDRDSTIDIARESCRAGDSIIRTTCSSHSSFNSLYAYQSLFF